MIHWWERAAARLFRGGWAARLAHRAGLQGALVVRAHHFTIPRAAGAGPLRVAFASDFHAGPTTDVSVLRGACDALAAMRADVVLLGGDFVAFAADDVEALVPHLARVRAPLGVFAVLGNHDLATDARTVVAALERAGVTMLTNRATRLPAPHEDVLLCGLDDPILGTPRADRAFGERVSGEWSAVGISGVAGDAAAAAAQAAAALTRTAGVRARLVLMHAPDGLLAIGERHFELAFCGHTHGGQIALPWGLPILLPPGRLSRRFYQGLYTLRRAQRLLVSRGVGCSTIPFRIGAPPEVHLCTLDPA